MGLGAISYNITMSKEESLTFPPVEASFTDRAREACKFLSQTFWVYGPRAVLHSAMVRKARLTVHDQGSLDHFINEHEITFPIKRDTGFIVNVEPLNRAGLFTIYPRQTVKFFYRDDLNVHFIQRHDGRLPDQEYRRILKICGKVWKPEDFLDDEKLKEAAWYSSNFYHHVIDVNRQWEEKLPVDAEPRIKETIRQIIDYFDAVVAAGNF